MLVVAPEPVAAPSLVSLPPATFLMGADAADDKFASVLEQPRHAVTIRPFAMGKYPVTFAEWDAYADAVPGAHRPDDCGFGRGSLPVFNVSWDDAVGYVEWLADRTGRALRMPSEAEWEYGCRAGTQTVFNTGSRLSVQQANYLYTDFREKPGPARPLPVGSFPPNALGLCDMHGNVAELVADTWHDSYTNAPADGSAWTHPPDSPWRVVRNGGWDALPRLLRSPFRDWVRRDQRFDNMGFRVACDIFPVPSPGTPGEG